jgi:chromosome segregation ATPase
MGKSIENRTSLGMVFLAHITRQELKHAPYKPGLPGLYDKYEKTIEQYSDGKNSVVGRKKALKESLDAFDTEVTNQIEATKAYKAEFDKAHADNIAKYLDSDKKYQEAKTADKDPKVMNGLLKDWIAKLGDVAKQDKTLQDKKEKANSDFVKKLEKMAKTYEKESKEIETLTAQLTKTADGLEAQMKALLLTNKKIADKLKNTGLSEELGEALPLLLQ